MDITSTQNQTTILNVKNLAKFVLEETNVLNVYLTFSCKPHLMVLTALLIVPKELTEISNLKLALIVTKLVKDVTEDKKTNVSHVFHLSFLKTEIVYRIVLMDISYLMGFKKVLLLKILLMMNTQ